MAARDLLEGVTLKDVVGLVRDHRAAQIANELHYAYHALRAFRSARLSYSPLWLMLFVTARCNLRCLHCPYHSPESPREPLGFQDMSMELFAEVLDRFPKTRGIALTGGEPLLNPRVFEMAQVARERCITVHMPTNGTLLSSNMDSLLAAPLDLLNVSLYGTDAASFAQLTGAPKAVFHKVLEAVEELADRRSQHGYPRVLRASFVCTRQTMHQIVELVRLCEEVGFDRVRLRNLHCYGVPGYGPSACLYADDPEVHRLIAALEAEQFAIPVTLPKLHKRPAKARSCTMPFWLLNIDGDGYIGPCYPRGTSEPWDNVLEAPDVWNSPTLVEARRLLLDTSQPQPESCGCCEEMVQGRPTLRRT